MCKAPFILIAVAVLTALTGCSDDEPTLTDNPKYPMRFDGTEYQPQRSPEATRKRRMIAAALESLLHRNNDDAFVICSHVNSQEYVQFAVNDQGVFLDLPTIPLDDKQKQRAIAFFESAGVGLDDSQMLAEPGGHDVGSMQIFQAEIKHDANRGAEMALDIFYEVYRLPDDFPLAIEEN